MSAALLVLAGTLVGALGALGVELVRSHGEGRRSQREAVRVACTEFALAISYMREAAFDLYRDPRDSALLERARITNRDARAKYEYLRLVTGSMAAQEAARRALRHAHGMQLLARGLPARDDEKAREPQGLVQDYLTKLFIEVRREAGVPHAHNVYQEPDRWLGLGKLSPVKNHSGDAPANGEG